jgi:hypothetical protein
MTRDVEANHMALYRYCIIVFVLLISLSFSNIASETTLKDLITGYWYGSSVIPEQKLNRKWIVHLEVSGKFKIFFKEYNKKQLLKSWTESGTWDLRGTIHSTTIHRIVMGDGSVVTPDTPDGVFYDEYEVLEINDKILKYRNIKNDVVYTVKRVPEGTEI